MTTKPVYLGKLLLIVFLFSVNCAAKPPVVESTNLRHEQVVLPCAFWGLMEEDSPRVVLPSLELLRQDYAQLELRRSVLKTPLRIGKQTFSRGLGTHATSHISVNLPENASAFVASVGIDNNNDTKGKLGSVVFHVELDGKKAFKSEVLRGGVEPVRLKVPLGGAKVLDLHVSNAGDNDSHDQCNWADAAIIMKDGRKMWLDEIPFVPTAWLGEKPPFSFVYGGKDSSKLLRTWQIQKTSRSIDKLRTIYTATYKDAAGTLEVKAEAIRYADFPAIEWVLHFRNISKADSQILEGILPLDVSLTPKGNHSEVHAARGGLCGAEDYKPLQYPLSVNSQVTLNSGGGRSSNNNLPFFCVDAGGRGVVAAVGWSGNWSANISLGKDRKIRLRAGMAKTRIRLKPGESIRTPRILLVAWDGDRLRGHNDLRRLIYKHHTPLLAGKKPLPPTQCNTWFPCGDGTRASAANQIELLKAYKQIGIEYMVMDAGWYGDSANWWTNAGSWRPRKDTFPDGLKPVGKAAADAGIKFGMWFEPERVASGSDLDKQHPEWLLKLKGRNDRLLNLGLPEAQKWFIEMVSGYVKDVPLGYFRHDFNMDPLPYWQGADEPDRIGMTEIRYIEGLYNVWDELHKRFPELMIEGCASGGRRIDLESISRCHTYWKSDMYGDLLANQAHIYGASLYLPGNYLNTPLFDLSESMYALHSQFGGALCVGWDPRPKDFNRRLAAKRVEEFKKFRHLFVGDFYPLMDYNLRPTDWTGYQFHRADLNEGVALLFRHSKSRYTGAEVMLQGLDPDCLYEVKFGNEAATRQLTGKELLRLKVSIDQSPGSRLIHYRAVSR